MTLCSFVDRYKILENLLLHLQDILEMEEEDPFRTPVYIYQTTWCHIPEDSNLHSQRSEAFTSFITYFTA
jgi:hypothetical protein